MNKKIVVINPVGFEGGGATTLCLEYAKLGIIGLSKSDTEEISASPADNPPQHTSDAPVKTVFASDDNPSDDDAATVIIVK